MCRAIVDPALRVEAVRAQLRAALDRTDRLRTGRVSRVEFRASRFAAAARRSAARRLRMPPRLSASELDALLDA